VPTPETLPQQNRGYRLKSQIKFVQTWHYILSKDLIRSNNINDLRPAERPSLLKISQSEQVRWSVICNTVTLTFSSTRTDSVCGTDYFEGGGQRWMAKAI